jgi:hypothetical protein
MSQERPRLGVRATLDDYLLELILMDTIAVAGGRLIPGAERVIQRFLPMGLYDRIIARYDALSDDQDDDGPDLLRPWLKMAASKDSRWKRRMIVRFLCIMAAGGPAGYGELAEIAALATAMGAARECRQVFGLHPKLGAPIGGIDARTRRPVIVGSGNRE